MVYVKELQYFVYGKHTVNHSREKGKESTDGCS